MKKMSSLIAIVMIFVFVITISTVAYAATNVNMTIGQTEPLEISGDSITNAYSSNSSIVTVETVTGGKAYVKAVQEGTATVTVYYVNNNISRTYDFVITVAPARAVVNLANIGDFDISNESYFQVNSMTSSNTGVCKVNFHEPTKYVVITATGKGTAIVTYDGYRNGKWEKVEIQVNVANNTLAENPSSGSDINLTIGDTWASSAYYETISCRSENETVAKINVDSYGRNVVTAAGQGATSITYTYRTSKDGPLQSVTHKVYVSTSSSGSSGSGSSGTDISINVGSNYNIAKYQIHSATSSSNAVAMPVITGSPGSAGTTNMGMRIQGMAAGKATVTMEYSDTSGGSRQSVTYTVTVGGGGDSSTTTPAKSNISFSKSSFNVPRVNDSGKVVTYRCNPLVNGVAVKAETMLWLSSDTNVMTVDAATGVFKGVKAGSAKLICADKAGENISFTTITIT